jgi:hypothetical protein
MTQQYESEARMTKQKLCGWATRMEMHGRIAMLTVAADSLAEACEILESFCGPDIDPAHVCETTTVLRADEPKELESYLEVPVDWRDECQP